MKRLAAVAAVLIAGSAAAFALRPSPRAAVAPAAPADAAAAPGAPAVPQAPARDPGLIPDLQPMESPTGRRPLAIWTPTRQALWQQLLERGDRDMENVIRSAGLSGSDKQRYADLGQWATVAYQVTGNRSFAEKAWARIERKTGKRPPNRNFTREHLVEYAWMYDWLKPALTEEQRRRYIEMMNDWCRLTLGKVPGVSWGTRTGDSDELVGHYFGLALWAAVSGAENPEALVWLNAKPVGGTVSTGTDRKTWRNAISQHVRNARGGVWVESSKYNLGTLRLLFFGAEALRTATGRDDFPEITALLDEVAAGQIHEVTPDLKQAYQWGDEESPRSLSLDRRCSLLALLTGLVRNEVLAGRILSLLNALPSEEIRPRELALYNPLRPAYDRRPQTTAFAAEGMGFVFGRGGWEPDAAFFGAQMSSRIGADHEVHHFGNFQLYRGEWVVTHPIGYDATDGQYVNGMLLGGWPSMWETRGLIDHGITEDGIVVAVGATAGSPYGDGYMDPPPSFLHEWTRSLVFVPSHTGTVDFLLVHDRTRMQNPKTLPGFDRYHPRDQARMNREIPLGARQWLVHMPVEPAIQDRTIRWATDMGQPVQVTTVWPERVTHRVLDERTQVPMGKYVKGSEKGWQVRVIPLEDQEWQTFLHVIQVGEGPVQVRPVREGSWEGVVISRRGEPDRTVLFNAEPGPVLPRMKTSGGKLVRNRALLDPLKNMSMVQIR